VMLNIVAVEEIMRLARIEREDQQRQWQRVALAGEIAPKGPRFSFRSFFSGFRVQKQPPLTATEPGFAGD
jgi:hypothetical protein